MILESPDRASTGTSQKLVHWTCCDDTKGLCGTPTSTVLPEGTATADCLVCIDLEEAPCCPECPYPLED